MDPTLWHTDGLLELAPEGAGSRPGVKRALVGHGARVVMFRFAAGQVLGEILRQGAWLALLGFVLGGAGALAGPYGYVQDCTSPN